MTFDNNWKDNFKCEGTDCTNARVRFLSDDKNHSIRKVCFNCFSSRAVKKTQQILLLVDGVFDEFRSFRDNYYAEIRRRAGLKFMEFLSRESDENFYDSKEWKRLRYDVLCKYESTCPRCGRCPPEVIMHVDHIEPRSKAPEKALDPNNLQILCADCNQGKSNRDSIDLRGRMRPKNKPDPNGAA